jgi:hypothetical protein
MESKKSGHLKQVRSISDTSFWSLKKLYAAEFMNPVVKDERRRDARTLATLYSYLSEITFIENGAVHPLDADSSASASHIYKSLIPYQLHSLCSLRAPNM